MFDMDNRYTSGRYAEHNPNWHDEDASWKAIHVARLLQDEHVEARSLCDIGCGAGGVLAGLSTEMPFLELVGYDISPQAVEYAHLQHPDIDVRLGDATSERSHHFDIITLIDVFEHVEDYIGFLRSVRPLGDYIVCHIPLDMNALGVARASPIAIVREQVGHLHYFSKDTALATLRDAGFKVQAYRYTAGTLELPNRTIRMKFMKWPRKIAFGLSPDLTVRILGGFSLLVLAQPL
jgi:2-polyprenyl-3-methyl-5-hydroxy-6-metoxy-1,4-benzoquinol methylase